VPRPLPSPLDVLAALGNPRALHHLQSEFARYGYQENLQALCDALARHEGTVWQGSLYHQLLYALRTLHTQTNSDEQYPPALCGPAWADKMLHTQLAAWAQLRHDNILYVKEPYTGVLICDYPAGYVEPYPAFYEALGAYADMGAALFAGLSKSGDAESAEIEESIREMATAYFGHLRQLAGRLQTLAEKELRQLPFSAEEELWLKQPAVRSVDTKNLACGVEPTEEWAGWYTDLLTWREKYSTPGASPACIADVHTCPPSELFPGQILHVATGQVALALIMVSGDQGDTVYAGPALTYYEKLTEYPERMTDEGWESELYSGRNPTAPEWTKGFRWSAPPTRQRLELPPTWTYRQQN
jgi:hypothetical protein